MKRFDIIEHTADTGIIARGRNLAEAFANAAFGMFSIMADLSDVRQENSIQVELKEEDMEALLFEWLNYLLYVFDVHQLLLNRFDVEHLDGQSLKATCYGEKYDPSRHQLKTGVKSATYHMLEVDRENNTVRIILDV